MARKLTLRTLVDEFRNIPVKSGLKPLAVGDVADRIGISRQYLYDLMAGTKVASPWVESLIVNGLGEPKTRVVRALEGSRESAALLE